MAASRGRRSGVRRLPEVPLGPDYGTIASPMALLDDDEIQDRLAELDGWARAGDAIERKFDRGDFVGSVAFARAVVEPAEEMNHHPDLAISWSEVTVTISTHSEGGLTAADFELAKRIDSLV
jgi:4a-hydroxytetrahydrobiopterin dehydratase